MELFYSVLLICLLIVLIRKSKKKDETQSEQPKADPIIEKPAPRPLTDAECEAQRQADEAFDYEAYHAISRREYTGPLPEYDGAYWSSLYPNLYHTKIAGINFQRGVSQFLGEPFDGYIDNEPKNKFDPNAIKVIHGLSGKRLGYIPADEIEDVRSFIDNALPCRCRCKVNVSEEYNYDTERYRKFYIGYVNIIRPENS